MNRVRVAPFLRPLPDRITPDVWQFAGHATVPDRMPDWDPATRIIMHQEVTLDVAGIWADCHLGVDARAGIFATWHSPGTSLRGAGQVIPLDASMAVRSEQIDLEIDGALLAGELRVRTCLVLLDGGNRMAALAPATPGNVLWVSERRILLEGSGGRFPVEVIDFQNIWPAASWYLEWNRDAPEALFMGSVRLLINAGNPVVVRAVTSTKADPEQSLILSTIYFDVGRTLVCGMLENDDFVGDPDRFGEGSVGCLVKNMIRIHFPGETAISLRALMRQSPDRFESRLQGIFHLFRQR